LKHNIISNLKFVLAVLTDVYHYFSVVMAPTAICYRDFLVLWRQKRQILLWTLK